MGAALMRRTAASTLSLSCAYCESIMKTPSGPASTPMRPPAASSCEGSSPAEPLGDDLDLVEVHHLRPDLRPGARRKRGRSQSGQPPHGFHGVALPLCSF